MRGVSTGEGVKTVPSVLNTSRQISNVGCGASTATVRPELTRISQQSKRGGEERQQMGGPINPHHLRAQLSQTSVFHKSPWFLLVSGLSTRGRCAHTPAVARRWSLTSTLGSSLLTAVFICMLHCQTPVLRIVVHSTPVITSMCKMLKCHNSLVCVYEGSFLGGLLCTMSVALLLSSSC